MVRKLDAIKIYEIAESGNTDWNTTLTLYDNIHSKCKKMACVS